MNCYANLSAVKADLSITATSQDAMLLRYIEACSRALDRYCNRFFYVETGVRYQSAIERAGKTYINLDADLLSVSAFTADSELDGTYDGETWAGSTDYWLFPYNTWPKTQVMETGFGTVGGLCTEPRRYKVTGNWGYGDGRSATPYESSGLTGTVATTTGTTLTASTDASSAIYPGNTILVESEQMFVSAVATTNITVERGVNGTMAAAHSAATINVYQYPKDISQFTGWLSQAEFKDRGKAGMQQERMGDYFYTRLTNDVDKRMMRCLAPYIRWN